MNSYDKRLIIGVGVFIVILALVGTLLFGRNKKPDYTVEKRDRDTGEVVLHEPNKTPEVSDGSWTLTILGVSALQSNGATSEQIGLVRDALQDYVHTKLADKYDTLKFLTATYTREGNEVKGKIRLADTSITVDTTITLTNLRDVRVVIKDTSGKAGGDYDSGPLTSKPLNGDYTGDGTPPVKP